ncbi:DDE-type integrase/transposase/recombinase [Proteiniclasticum sp. SCR006]|uniref:DDE-type integrase/transposase/recombinase n=1 Tax=Proteiniclasticum aestuarii TaxID=2817862 RepID=A0A939HBY4_9CLOT|nr:Mu transposase C-terminal domain-containing protein [Proteiniclasticum aestuarii]MBO1264503.1 DDE-type integrase/transposase/recombinase [Proteiniclasticum aestuarii]
MILVNSLLKLDESIYRVLWIDKEQYIVISMDENRMPIKLRKEEVNSGISNGDIIEIEEEIKFAQNSDIAKYLAKRDSNWNKLKVLLKDEPNIYEKKYRVLRLKTLQENIGYSEQHILSMMKRYWRSGKNKNSLMPRYSNSGAPGKERKSGLVKRGRPSRSEYGVNIDDVWKVRFEKAIQKYYYSRAKNSIIMTYHLMRKDYVQTVDAFPTMGQFRYWFNKSRSIKSEIKGRYSSKKYSRDFRPLLGTNETTMPGTFEIDAHMGDVYLVSDFNREYIIGRPTLYIVIDKYSRMIVGMYVGFDSSYPNAAMALYNCISDKVEFCNHFDINIDECEWPAKALPQKLIADRGEIEGQGIENLIESLGVEVELTPSHRADMKGIVEGFFNILNSHIKTILPGTIDMDGRERGDKDYRKSASLTMREYTKIVIHTVLFHNKNFLENYNRSEQMINDNLIPTPINLWYYSLENFGTSLKYSSNEIKLALMTKSEGVITRKGIKHKNLFYASKNFIKQGYFDKGGRKQSRVVIFFDRRNLSFIYVENPLTNEIEHCELLPNSEKFRNKSIEDCEILMQKESEIRAQFDIENQTKRAELIKNIEDIVDIAKKEVQTPYNSRDVKNIRVNRKLEKTSSMEEEAFTLE